MSIDESLTEEREAINSIYDSEILSFDEPANAILSIPNVAYSFTFSFPSTYPDEPPSIIGTHHVSASAKKGEGEAAADILRDILGRIFTPGQVCLFDLIEEATPILTEHGKTQDIQEHKRSASPEQEFLNDALITSVPPPQWYMSEPLIVNKSTFVARCVSVSSLRDATASISHLLSTNKKVATATHNITAWRIRSQDGPEIVIQDSDDDGETAAGGRLLHLMQLMDVWNVVVVVTRWYGGNKLGPDRFRCINAVAREALVNGSFVKEEKESGKGSGKKGRK